MRENFSIREIRENKAEICDEILRALPDWFGIEQAIRNYAKAVVDFPMFISEADGRVAGFLSLETHNPYTTEIHVMAVKQEFHRGGHGRALVAMAEKYSQAQRAEYLMVKTVGPSGKSTEYDRTREFYENTGFRPLQELKTLWDEHNPCLIMIKRL